MSAREAAFAVLENVLNRYIKLDPTALGRLAPLHGKRIRLHIRGLELDLNLVPAPDGIQLYPEFEGEPDCTLSGAPLAFARLGGGEQADQLFAGAVEIRGDTEAGQRFGDLLAGLDIDWEEQLSRLTGDVAAHQVGSGARAAGRWGRQTADILPADLAEYLQEEARLLPTRIESEEFVTAVDTLRDDVERLEARIRRLHNRGDSEA